MYGSSLCFIEGVSLCVVGQPRRTKHVDGLGEDVVVDETRVDGEHTHQQDDVAAVKQRSKHLQKEHPNGETSDKRTFQKRTNLPTRDNLLYNRK